MADFAMTAQSWSTPSSDVCLTCWAARARGRHWGCIDDCVGIGWSATQGREQGVQYVVDLLQGLDPHRLLDACIALFDRRNHATPELAAARRYRNANAALVVGHAFAINQAGLFHPKQHADDAGAGDLA